MAFILFIFFVVTQRLLELAVARKNEQWLLKNGAVEYGKRHYPLIVTLHTLFIISMIMDYNASYSSPFDPLFFGIFMVLILLKIWVIASLGRYWNTKIYRIRHADLISKGPYKFVKHPNYMIVVAEIAVIPLVFHLYYTAIVFTLLNAAMLYVRISVENRILAISE